MILRLEADLNDDDQHEDPNDDDDAHHDDEGDDDDVGNHNRTKSKLIMRCGRRRISPRRSSICSRVCRGAGYSFK